MGIYHERFRWPLPPTAATATRYVESLAASIGYPCQLHALYEHPTHLTACFRFPGLWKGDSITLTPDVCDIEFALVPFFWAHATATIQDLGGVFERSDACAGAEWKRRTWRELKWTERARIRVGLGLGMSVM